MKALEHSWASLQINCEVAHKLVSPKLSLWNWGSGAPGHYSLCCNKAPQSTIHYQWIPWGAFSPVLKRDGFAIVLCWSTNFWSGLDSTCQHQGNQNLISKLVQDKPDIQPMVSNTHSRSLHWFWVKGLVVRYLWNWDYSFLPVILFFLKVFIMLVTKKFWQFTKLNLSEVQKTWNGCM